MENISSLLKCNRSLSKSRDSKLLEINNMHEEIMRTAKILPHYGRKKNILNLKLSLISNDAFQHLVCTP